MTLNFRLRIPSERVAVLIGHEGLVKKKIEATCNVKLNVDGETGEVEIIANENVEDPTMPFKAQNIVLAVGRSFSPEKAFKLLGDDVLLQVIDLRDFTGRSKSDLRRIKGRLIGKNGKTRRIIEETTDADVSIYGYTVSIIGKMEELEAAKKAVEKLIAGSQHKTVYRFLERKRHEMKKEKLKIWES